jgi:hypothetical protein
MTDFNLLVSTYAALCLSMEAMAFVDSDVRVALPV